MVEELIKILEMSWCKETCTPSMQDDWNESNKAIGQCAVTALIVNDFLGGMIMRCMTESGSYYYNFINNSVIDLTSSQFTMKPNYTNGEVRSRDYLLSNEDTKKRYLLLLNRVKDNFIKYGTGEYELLGMNGIYLSKIPATCGGNSKLKVYGKVDCPNVLCYRDTELDVFFENKEVANKLGYRPCAACMRKEYLKWKESKMKY